MSKRVISMMAVIFCISLVMAGISSGFVLLTKEEALEKIFGKELKITPELKELKGESLARVLKKLGGKLVDYQEGSESARVQGSTKIEFYIGSKDGKNVGAAIIEVEPGKWGPVEFIVAMDFTGKVRSVQVMSYEEKRGRPIAQYSYMRQYEGKTTKDPLEVGNDITGISGATISSRCATFTVKKALVLFEELYLNK